MWIIVKYETKTETETYMKTWIVPLPPDLDSKGWFYIAGNIECITFDLLDGTLDLRSWDRCLCWEKKNEVVYTTIVSKLKLNMV